MNNKRQTIWLVSMLSLMVILSAYYLFTEDLTSTNKQAQQQTQETDATKTLGAVKDNGITVTDIGGTDGITDPATDGTDKAASGKTDKNAAASPDPGSAASPDAGKAATASPDTNSTTGSAVSPADKEVLKGMTNLTGREYFDKIQLQRETDISKKLDDLDAILGDTSKTQEEATQAIEQKSRIDATEERITSLEEKLLADFENAVVEETENNFKVTVQADKLDTKQAVKIVSLATKELNVTPDHVSVQYVQ